MGRTLHYTLKKDSKFTRKEEFAMYDITEKYNSGKYKDVWTCENFGLDTVAFYPNWQNPKFTDANVAWALINHLLAKAEKLGTHYIDAVRELQKARLVNFHNKVNEVHGFTKTQGNEFNSLLVLLALVELSKEIPKAEISLYDEGEFLFCKLKIKNGLALPDIDDLLDDIKGYAFKMLFSPGFEGNVLDRLEYKATDFEKCLAQDVGFDNSYGDMTKYINGKLRNLKAVNDALVRKGLKDNEFYLYNFKQRKLENWFDPIIFTRPVDIDKFTDYVCSPATLMDGFSGEAFGLSDEDAESKSYNTIAMLQKMLEGAGWGKENLQVLPKISK